MPFRRTLAFTSLLSLLIVAASSPAWAQVSMKGVVLDPSGALIVGASVELKPDGQAAERSTRTDARGKFEFRSIVPGTYEIHVQYPGFNPLAESIQVGRSTPHALKLVLAIATERQQSTVTAETQGGGLETSECKYCQLERPIARHVTDSRRGLPRGALPFPEPRGRWHCRHVINCEWGRSRERIGFFLSYQRGKNQS